MILRIALALGADFHGRQDRLLIPPPRRGRDLQDATFLFTDIEGSTRLWEEEPERMKVALASHDTLARAAVEEHRGQVVKMTGDGVHAVFDDPLDAVLATLRLQLAMAEANT